jgi:hypothetical protein
MTAGRPPRLTPAALGLVAVATLAAVFAFVPPVRQDAAFHQFADRRTLLGIPNAMDVVSNIPFFIVGWLGVVAIRDARRAWHAPWERGAWLWLFGAVLATGVGSTVYHLAPTDATLFWDRLPQTTITVALVCIVLAERTDVGAARAAFPGLVALGAASVVVWRATGDLRLYGAVQFFPALALPSLLALDPPRYTRADGYWIALGWFAVARLCEVLDREIYGVVGIGGHTLKHIAAAASVWALVRMVRDREPEPGGDGGRVTAA